ncbi:hypothetical protein FE661_12550 [Acidithiobacillus ferrooxidans]|nr:hypothetical protein FE661_12550 [Acidithiobacillus ferrooxidans]
MGERKMVGVWIGMVIALAGCAMTSGCGAAMGRNGSSLASRRRSVLAETLDTVPGMPGVSALPGCPPGSWPWLAEDGTQVLAHGRWH